jgi:hypothetical protein
MLDRSILFGVMSSLRKGYVSLAMFVDFVDFVAVVVNLTFKAYIY